MSNLKWVKSSYSGSTGANCVEIAVLPNGKRAVRDSKKPEGSIIYLTRGQWAGLLKSLLEPGRRERERPRCETRSVAVLYFC